ncbi:60 kDa SS-A/Ro ribonucleoprotein isoform X1 [Synchiropus splendidus]|uniref:60 kDa SS-A/Ro ribonucleoprotein isoform X1 n=1 Tax=Synchiropus splendidus TaxID=270530 RepID=UPI00237D4AB5|nr:60 kDa SS-A/Ro ribonucleoprotein isoform X1 [Synchiropus splendidus]
MEPSGKSCSRNHTQNASGDACSWEINDKVRLCRFLCYGSEQKKYTAGDEGRISVENAEALQSLLQAGQGSEVVEEIKRFAQDGRASRFEPCFFALALCSQHCELKTRQAAFKALKEICHDPAHLFTFINFKTQLKEGMKCGIWGRALRQAVSDWYNEQDAVILAAAMTKCKQREGWSHRDVLRLSHTKPVHEAIAVLSKYVTKGWVEVQRAYNDKENSEEVAKVLAYLEVVEKVKHSYDETEVVALIEEHKLEREMLLTDHLKSKQVWHALLKEMPLQSIVKALGKIAVNKVLEPESPETRALCDRIQSDTEVRKSKLHPFSLLVATEKYKKGQGYQGKTKWKPDSDILKALDSAFYKSFLNVNPVGKRFVVAVDVSSSMSRILKGTSIITPVAAAAVAMVPAKSTDCTLPVTWATENKEAVDVFIVLTNNAFWPFCSSPVESLRKHRQTTGSTSKLVICDLTASASTMEDIDDRGLMNLCGFDLGAFSLIHNLALDLI